MLFLGAKGGVCLEETGRYPETFRGRTRVVLGTLFWGIRLPGNELKDFHICFDFFKSLKREVTSQKGLQILTKQTGPKGGKKQIMLQQREIGA